MASKILLVEDDNNLREIYQARLQAEGYEIVLAKDGEEALVIAKKEQPDLIISDVMMPRVSGFEMLDILRNTEGLKDPKVIMLTALGQSDDQVRAQQLGADRYLVKSQVTLEDIVKAAKDLLDGGLGAPESPATVAPPSTSTPTPDPAPVAVAPPVNDDNVTTPSPTTPPSAPVPQAKPVAPTVTPPAPPASSGPLNDQLIADALKDLTSATSAPVPQAKPVAPTVTPPATVAPPSTSTPTPDPAPVAVAPPVNDDNVTTPSPTTPPSAPMTTTSNDYVGGDSAPVAHKKIIKPLSDDVKPDTAPNLDELLAKEQITSDPNTSSPQPLPDAQTSNIQPGNGDEVPPHQPGHVISPTAGQSAQNPDNQIGDNAVDPNSIAL